MSFWGDPVFAGSHANTPNVPASDSLSNVKQSVGKVDLTSDQLKLYEEEPPKFTSWDGFWADPVFAGVAGRRQPIPPGEKREFWKYEVDDSVSLSSLFPELSSSAFGSVSFRKSAIEWWSKPIVDQPAGLYLRTEIELNGLLDEVFHVFREFLGDVVKPTLRLSAYLGVSQIPDGTYAADGLSFTGSLLGLRTPMPPGLEIVTILSVGIKLNVGRTNSTPEIESPTAPAKSQDLSCTIFGDLHVMIPGLTGPLLLKYNATSNEAFLRLDMSIPGDGKWRNPLGVESLLLDEARFLVHIPLQKAAGAAKPGKAGGLAAPKSEAIPSAPTEAELAASLSFTVSAKWKTSSSGTVGLQGVVYKQYPDASYIQGTLEKVTWSDIEKLFSDIHGQDLEPSDHEITCEKLTVRISKAELLLTGALTLNGRHLAQATIAITSAGIVVRADVHEWPIEDGYITINDASLTLMVGCGTSTAHAGQKGKETSAATQKSWYGGLEVAGRITIREGVSKPIDIQVTLAAGKQDKEWFWVVCGGMNSDLSLRDIISSIEEKSELDVRLKSVSLVAASTNDPKCSLNSNGYVIKQGFYLWATLEQIPYVQTGGAVKAPAAGDSTQLAIGWEKGSKIPNISIFLPPSLKIDIGPRFRSDRFELQVGGLSLRFVGGFQVRLDDEGEWLRFQLGANVSPTEVSGEL
ncbi:uncharacterized protein A1O5_07169 [Cladophialophora psammophila CBS 110553]|uniref:Uncharacterized protein n=1 Tax=Cladophialophora psammophila CBS 110553 TaxID=1182543 RepID=W9WZJ0_9EURO|nr:uncharacterized protein A1O5_07169 [Cladophialophora psammophila CBS 110553]EXJ70096.1 hypothetical protein A1O5_07169 [Cladophialophora psammophila CBS 110553]